ncbi:MAG: NHL repeat-containing protein, partial [Anaerolineaceae bacterium]|nr:NHL repeat-containing protein [Anaerolineaceae bacterium]
MCNDHFKIKIYCFFVLATCCMTGAARAVTLEPGDLIVADFNGAFDGPVGSPLGGRIIKVDPDTGAQTIISSGNLLNGPYDVALDATGNIIVMDAFDQQIIKVNPADGSQTVISEGGLFHTPHGIAIDAAGKIIVADVWYGGTGGILKVDPVTGAQTVISSGGSLIRPSGVTIDAAGNLYVTSSVEVTGGWGLSVVKVNPTTGAQTVISSGTFRTMHAGIVIDDSTGNIFVAEQYYNNGIIKVDPTGAQTFLASGSPFQDPYQLNFDLAGNIVAADTNWFWEGRIIRVDPGTGAKTLISSGGLLVDPAGIVVFEGAVPPGPPVAVCQNVTVAAGLDCTADASVDNGSYDPDGDPITVVQDTVGPYPLGDTLVTLTVTDDNGQSDQC